MGVGEVGGTSTYSKDWGEGDGYPKKENMKYHMKAYLNTSQLKNKKSVQVAENCEMKEWGV